MVSIQSKRKIRSNGVFSHKEQLSYGEYPKNWSKELKLAQATRHFEIMKDSVEMVENTLSEDTFRNRYESALTEARIVVNLCGRKGLGIRANRVLKYLTKEKEQIINEFVLRCQESA